MNLGLEGARVLIAGGSGGMGRAAAEAFAGEHAHVAILARGSAAVEETVTALLERGSPVALGLVADLTDGASLDRAFDVLRSRWTGLDVLVNAAGPVSVGVGSFDDIDDDEWKATFDIGTLGAVRCIRRALPMLRLGTFGRIVNVSAHSTKRQSPELIAYTAAKAALTSLTKNLAQSLAPENILVNTVSPGSFLSEGMKGYLQGLPPERGIDSESLTDAMRVIREDFGHPAYLDRAGDPTEIGPLIAFLGSRVNSYMTGADVNVDGGSDFT
jgi:NAD(P)-dependent dehydrogenase (short-subunit alcohol dehydrogenase family)